MNKVSILMPTYNDAKYIESAMDSVLYQKYNNWELLICDDGSTDNTRCIVEKYIKHHGTENKIKYFYQENADQLNALINLIPHITGDYVYILHSDDLLYDDLVIEKMVRYMQENAVDSIIADVAIIDKFGNLTGVQKVSNYIDKKRIIPLQMLWLGRNLYIDMAFHRKNIFINSVYKNYLLWNGPFWLNLDNNTILKVEKVSFPFFKYRIFEENYINTDGANLNVINGEIRVVTQLLNSYYIPLYKIQYIIYRLFNKANIGVYYPVIYFNKETKNKYKIINFVLKKRFNYNEIKNNLFLNALDNFYKNYQTRKIYVDDLKDDVVYFGKDMRLFNKKIMNGVLSESYNKVLSEMKKGFNEIVIHNDKDVDKVIILTKFLCIYPYVKITIEKR